jgi:uncharacterized protein YdcH (DUF465 family)
MMNSLEDRQIKEILMRDNVTFKNLNLKHQELDRKLREISAGNIRTEKEWIEEHNLKKQKLVLKDSMQQYISEYRKQLDN